MNKHASTRPTITRALLLLVCLCLCHVQAPMIVADSDESKKVMARVKSAFLLNFIKYTQWPEEAFEEEKSPIVIVVLGEDPLGEVLDQTMAKAKLHGRAIKVRRVALPTRDTNRSKQNKEAEQQYQEKMDELAEAIQSCQLIYYPGARQEVRQWLAEHGKRGKVLTVGEGSEATEDGLMLGFTIQKRKLRFNAGYDTIKASDVEVSSRLLGLAQNKPEGKS